MLEIPKEMQQFCKDVGKLCVKYQLRSFAGTFDTPFDSDFRNRITMNWDQGRHGADQEDITISARIWKTTKISSQE